MTSESEVQEQIVALLHSLPSDSSRRRVGLWLRDAALPDLLSAAPLAGPGTTDHDGVLVGRELLSSISADPNSASVDTLTCGACQKDFALADIVRFIHHKVLTCNKENHPCKSKSASAAANESDGESNNNNSADADKPALENGEKGKGDEDEKMDEGASSSSSDKENSAGSGGSKKKQKRGVQPLPPVTEMAAAAATKSFDDLPDEIVLKIFKMAASENIETRLFRGVRYDHYFIQGVLFEVSTRLRRIATDSSLWKGKVVVHTEPDFRELDFIIEECLNSRTTSMEIWIGPPFGTLPTIPHRYLIDLAKEFPNLKMLEVWSDKFEGNIPAPWSIIKESEISGYMYQKLTRD